MPRKHNASIVRYTTAVLPSCKQCVEWRVQSPVIKHTAGRVAFLPQPVGLLPLAQNAWHCTSSTIISVLLRGMYIMVVATKHFIAE